MKRDMDLCRRILLAAESSPADKWVVGFPFSDEYGEHLVGEHVALLADAGLVDANITRYYGGGMDFTIKNLTWAGHDFLDAARDEGRWAKRKNASEPRGTASASRCSRKSLRALPGQRSASLADDFEFALREPERVTSEAPAAPREPSLHTDLGSVTQSSYKILHAAASGVAPKPKHAFSPTGCHSRNIDQNKGHHGSPERRISDHLCLRHVKTPIEILGFTNETLRLHPQEIPSSRVDLTSYRIRQGVIQGVV